MVEEGRIKQYLSILAVSRQKQNFTRVQMSRLISTDHSFLETMWKDGNSGGSHATEHEA